MHSSQVLSDRSYQVIEHIETYFRAVFAVTVLTVVQNVRDFLIIVLLISTLNWLAGYIADVKQGKKYQHNFILYGFYLYFARA